MRLVLRKCRGASADDLPIGPDPVDVIHKLKSGTIQAVRAKPRRAIWELSARLRSGEKSLDDLRQSAKVNAILGSCPKSLPSVKSGIKCWSAFAKTILGKSNANIFNIHHNDLLVWAETFKSKGTFCNYLGYAKTACLLAHQDVGAFDHPLITKAKCAVDKKNQDKGARKLFIKKKLLGDMVEHADKFPVWTETVNWCLLAYTFALGALVFSGSLCQGSIRMFTNDSQRPPVA